MTESSSSPMETDGDTSDGESVSKVGSVISVGKFSSDSDDSESKPSQDIRTETSNTAPAWGQYSVGSNDAVEFERDDSMVVDDNVSMDDTMGHSSTASNPKTGTDPQTSPG